MPISPNARFVGQLAICFSAWVVSIALCLLIFHHWQALEDTTVERVGAWKALPAIYLSAFDADADADADNSTDADVQAWEQSLLRFYSDFIEQDTAAATDADAERWCVENAQRLRALRPPGWVALDAALDQFTSIANATSLWTQWLLLQSWMRVPEPSTELVSAPTQTIPASGALADWNAQISNWLQSWMRDARGGLESVAPLLSQFAAGHTGAGADADADAGAVADAVCALLPELRRLAYDGLNQTAADVAAVAAAAVSAHLVVVRSARGALRFALETTWGWVAAWEAYCDRFSASYVDSNQAGKRAMQSLYICFWVAMPLLGALGAGSRAALAWHGRESSSGLDCACGCAHVCRRLVRVLLLVLLLLTTLLLVAVHTVVTLVCVQTSFSFDSVCDAYVTRLSAIERLWLPAFVCMHLGWGALKTLDRWRHAIRDAAAAADADTDPPNIPRKTGGGGMGMGTGTFHWEMEIN